MAITETVSVQVASVEVGDDYRVHLRQHKKSVDYSPEQALQLAGELTEAALDAHRLLAEDLKVTSDRIRSHPVSEAL